MKKLMSVFLIATLVIAPCAICRAEDGTQTVPEIVNLFERVKGRIVCTFAGLFDRENPLDIPAAKVEEPSYVTFGGTLPEEADESINTETWVMKEITLTAQKEYADPFGDVDVSLELTGNGRTYTVPGFWNGGSEWKVRFYCPSAGEWYGKTVCTDTEDGGLEGKTLRINCTEYTGELDIYRHGFVTTETGKKYLTYGDGTPFFYLGDTHWSLGDETVDMVKIISKKRAEQGFTVIQSEPIGAKFDFTDGITQADMPGLAEYDEKFAAIAENGLVHANSQFFFPSYMQVLIDSFGGYSPTVVSDGFGLPNDRALKYLEKISRYWVARYGAFPVLWTLGQEVDDGFYSENNENLKWNQVTNPYRLVEKYIDKYDCWDHPLTAHQEYSGATSAYGNGKDTGENLKVYNSDANPSVFRGAKAHSWYAAQYSPSLTRQSSFSVERDYWYNSEGKPSINYEGRYCYLWTKNFGSRMQGWCAYLSGMYGYGWGAHDTWSYLNTYDENTNSNDGIDTITSEEKTNATWQDALTYESSYQVGYMRRFLSSLKWWELLPRFDSRAYFTPAKDVFYVYASNADNSEAVVYFYSFSDGTVGKEPNAKNRYSGVLTGTVGRLEPKGEYKYRWFDPRTGESSAEGSFTASISGTYYIGERLFDGKPVDGDTVLHIYR